jgi:hypothetical protein
MDCCTGKKQQRSLYQTSGLLDKSRLLVYKKIRMTVKLHNESIAGGMQRVKEVDI